MMIKNVRNSLISFIALTLVGIAALLYAIFVLPRSNYQEGLIYGISSGFVLTGILGVIYSIYLSRHPKKAKEAGLQKNEERTQFIRMKTFSAVGQVMLILECLGCLVTGLMGYKEISLAVGIILFVQMVLFTVFSLYYSKKY